MIDLGRIRTKDIKTVGNEIMENHGTKFNTEFENNKKEIKTLDFRTSKRVRNKIAGYVTRHRKIEARK